MAANPPAFFGFIAWMEQVLIDSGLKDSIGIEPKFLLAVLASLVLGLLIGTERSYNGRAAGMRTYALVCMTAAILCAASIHPEVLLLAHTPAGIDPTRTVQGIMTGIGFLGSGLIIREGFSIKGLTSAACIWAAAGVGVLCGLHLIGEAILVSATILVVLIGVRLVEPLMPHRTYADMMIAMPVDSDIGHDTVKNLVGEYGFSVMTTSYAQVKNQYRMQMILRGSKNSSLEGLSDYIRRTPAIRNFELHPRKD